jgi:hypothetical protein
MHRVGLFCFMVLSSLAQADSLRCGSDLITVGESSVRALAKCGEPYAREPLIRTEVDKRGVSVQFQYAERWTYNFGPANFMQLVTVNNGQITDIEMGGRGF